MIEQDLLRQMYLLEKKSVNEIARSLNCSSHKVNYWMDKYSIKRRNHGEASYVKHNPFGDPFRKEKIDSLEKSKLYGIGLGLYWGEGTKSDIYNVRLGNSDYKLILKFIEFLKVIYNIDENKLRFSVQLFSDTDIHEAEKYWQETLGYSKNHFYKSTITISGSIGTYKKKSKYGVLTVYFSNKKLRDELVDSLPNDGVKYC